VTSYSQLGLSSGKASSIPGMVTSLDGVGHAGSLGSVASGSGTTGLLGQALGATNSLLTQNSSRRDRNGDYIGSGLDRARNALDGGGGGGGGNDGFGGWGGGYGGGNAGQGGNDNGLIYVGLGLAALAFLS
jgi:hypothetical protein